jgi:hypothetical protein
VVENRPEMSVTPEAFRARLVEKNGPHPFSRSRARDPALLLSASQINRKMGRRRQCTEPRFDDPTERKNEIEFFSSYR